MIKYLFIICIYTTHIKYSIGAAAAALHSECRRTLMSVCILYVRLALATTAKHLYKSVQKKRTQFGFGFFPFCYTMFIIIKPKKGTPKSICGVADVFCSNGNVLSSWMLSLHIGGDDTTRKYTNNATTMASDSTLSIDLLSQE